MHGERAASHEAVPVEIRRMLDTFRQELHRHTSNHGRCVLCGLPWLCTRVGLAAMALEAL